MVCFFIAIGVVAIQFGLDPALMAAVPSPAAGELPGIAGILGQSLVMAGRTPVDLFLFLALGICLTGFWHKRSRPARHLAHEDLQIKVRERTVQLAIANQIMKSEISAREKSMEELRRSEERFRLIAETIDEVFWVADAGLTAISYVSPAYERVWGRTCESLCGNPKSFLEAIHPDDLRRVAAARGEAGSGVPLELAYRILRPDGSIRHIRDRGFPVRDEGGAITCYVGVAEDITVRSLAEEARCRAEEKYRSLFEDAVEGIFQSSPEGRFLTVNPALARMLGYSSPEEVIACVQDISADLFTDPDSRKEFRRRLEGSGLVMGFECRMSRRDGSIIWVSIGAREIRDAGGKMLRCEGTFEEITERRRLEDQCRQAQKMEAVGVLAGGVAHDFNNLLTVINGYAEFLIGKLGKDDPMRGDLEQIQEAGKRAVSMTSQLLAFSRKQILQPQVLSLNDEIRGLTRILRRLIGEDIELEETTQTDLGLVRADPGQIQQIVMNLAVNARDAMPRGGKLTIETANADLEEEYVRRHTGVQPGPYVMLAISDNGTGMDPETQSHIFEPFFTTKGVGKGTGLGLSSVYGIVKQSGGFIWVYSEPGRGTTFKIYLPRVWRDEAHPAAIAGTGNDLRGNETILVVEDERSVRKFVVQVLRTLGYTVVEAAGAPEALQAAREEEGPISLMLTDVVMPEMSGNDLAAAIQSLRPGIKVLFASGYTSDAVVRHGMLDPKVAFLSKPFTANALARKVREVLDSADPSDRLLAEVR